MQDLSSMHGILRRLPGFVALIALVGLMGLLSACDPAMMRDQVEQPLIAEADEAIPNGQLPKIVLPQHYRLHLNIDPRQETFTGNVAITLDFTRGRQRFWLHGKALRVSDIYLLAADGRRIAASYEQVDETGVAEINLAEPFGPGEARLHIAYEADFNLALEGLYKVEENENAYAYTQFEAISARLAFPGFDEPDFKVPFDVSMTVPEGHTAIANTPLMEQAASNQGRRTVGFATSKPMPTYLVAFAVGPFDVVEWDAIPPSEWRDEAIPLRGIAVQGKGRLLDYALEHTASILQSLEDYFGIAYPYAKLDLLAVPDFNAGAMENVGAITYREVLLLLDEQATPRQIRRYELVHAHELAHQWFGNLVTPVWWDDIWLNESFATWMASVALDLRVTHANHRRDLLARSIGAMATDSLVSARQIRQPILSSHDIASAFDSITYSKGGGVLSMFEQFLGFAAFRAGVSQYLQGRRWQTATADDFIQSIAAQSGDIDSAKVRRAFQSFLQQPGLPILDVQTECTALLGKDAGFQVEIQQRRYFPLGSAGQSDQQWLIPVCLAYEQSGERQMSCRLLEEATAQWRFPGECPAWVLPNANGAAYYRWNQDSDGWLRILAAANVLSPEEQISLADSFVASFEAGGLSLAAFLDGVEMLAQLPTRQAVVQPMKALEVMADSWGDKSQRDLIRGLISQLYARPLAQLGLQAQDDYDTAEHQHRLVEFQALVVRDPALRAELTRSAASYVDFAQAEGAEVDNLGLMDLALTAAVQDFGLPFVTHLRDALLASSDPTFRRRAVNALAQAHDERSAAVVRDLVLDERLRNNEVIPILFYQVSQPETRDAAWAWFKAEFDMLVQRVPEWAQGRLSSVGASFCTDDERIALASFFEPIIEGLGGGPRALANALERIDLCMARHEHYQGDLRRLLASG